MCAQSLQSCLTLCDPTDCSPPGSSVHGIFQARILEWVAVPFSRGSSQPNHLQCRRPGFDPWRREWLPTPVFLPRESHGQKSLAGYSPWGRKESDTTERPNTTHRMDLSSIKNFSVSANQTVNIHFLCTILYYFYKVLKVTFRQNSKLSYCICNTVLEVLSSNCQS